MILNFRDITTPYHELIGTFIVKGTQAGKGHNMKFSILNCQLSNKNLTGFSAHMVFSTARTKRRSKDT
ncbi:hypothetical protein HMPREF3192_00478 [Atopobium deltae]|uniref:Uncharacterized protein n=1 Tax=Atopobium deltae TaxID=1393034 RepID=A0A133XW29_9ACTN|nr:hypothetical protein HMPREF3192_00478 [Atopobium deltae]